MKTVLLGDVVDINTESVSKNYPHDTVLYLDTSSVTRNIFSPPDKLMLSNAPSRAKRIVRRGDTIISTVRPNLEHYGYINKTKPNLIASTGFAVIRPKSEINPKFLYYWLTSPIRTNYFTVIADSSTSTFPAFNPSIIENLKINLPELEKQSEIADILSALDYKIELNRKMNETLEQMGQALFKHYFIDNPEAKKWDTVKISEVIKFLGGSQPPKSEHIYEQRDGYIRFIQNRDYSNTNHHTYIRLSKRNKLCNETDIMMDKYGEAGKVRYGIAGAYNVALAKIAPMIDDTQEFLRSYFQMPSTQKALEAASGASTRSSLNATTFTGLKVKMPPQRLLTEFENMQKTSVNKILSNKKETVELIKLRDSLLPRLISGKIEV